MPAKIEFSADGKVITLTSVDGIVSTFTSAPVVGDDHVLVVHADGSSEEFDKKVA